jgi:predicted amidohydrolase
MNYDSCGISLLGGKVPIFILIFLIFPMLSLAAMTPFEELHTVIVQFEMNDHISDSEDAYRMAMEEAMEKAMAGGPADLVIFPEYIGVFASLIPWDSYLDSDLPFEEVWATIRQDHPEISSLNDLFLSESERNDAFLNKLWGDLASRYGVYILSGTRLNYNPSRGGLVNQAVVYNPQGEVFYRQDKYFLTEFEEEILGLRPGNIFKTPGFTVKNHLIRLTICRDTFLKDWETLYAEGDLWIDIKANGVAYTEDQKSLFTRALPARLGNSDIPYGITACLTGKFLDLLWEGESSILYNHKGKVSYRDISDVSDSFEILRTKLP